MGRNTKMVAYGLGGIALALAMSLGAFALAGSTLSQPPPTVRIVGATQTPRPHTATADPTASPDDHGGGTTDPTPTTSASPDDHGGGDDHGGPGSGDDDHDDD
jgi:hypothetical protein